MEGWEGSQIEGTALGEAQRPERMWLVQGTQSLRLSVKQKAGSMMPGGLSQHVSGRGNDLY